MLDIILHSLTAVFGSFMCHVYTFWLFANCIDIADEIVGCVLTAELYFETHFVRSYKLNRSLFCTVSYFILLLSATLAATELLLNYSVSVSVTVRHMNIQI